jgi:hypothetical protein
MGRAHGNEKCIQSFSRKTLQEKSSWETSTQMGCYENGVNSIHLAADFCECIETLDRIEGGE